MKYGLILPNVGPMADIQILASLAREAEERGFSGVFLSDHISIPTHLESAYPYRSDGRFPLTAADQILEPVTALSYLAAVTQRVHLGFSVLILPYRHAVLNAKMMATLDVMAGGRLIIGAGVGWMEEEFRVLGADFVERGHVTDEHIATLRWLWGDTRSNGDGQPRIDLDAPISPLPVQKPSPPIWTGGISRPALLRAANLGDGWHGVRQSPEDVVRVVARIAELRQRSGMSMEGYEISLRAGLDISDEDFGGAGRTPLRGSPDQIFRDLAQYAQAGVSYLVLEPRAGSADQFIAQLDRFGQFLNP